ncbi:hypothetical protein PR048_014844 [Dryococelus australis]|uniref:Uncharacterized protein n=1 Tax=Dryococelus australis TaxID=614101 RepID=A0ABQ9HF94_9NEOP|nr:hypothetical protein PR048_014844 [Dryococelus australis]
MHGQSGPNSVTLEGHDKRPNRLSNHLIIVTTNSVFVMNCQKKDAWSNLESTSTTLSRQLTLSTPTLRARWRSSNSLDSHSGEPGFDSRSGHPDFGFPWFTEITRGEFWDRSVTKAMADVFLNPSCAICSVSNDLAVDDTLSQQSTHLPPPDASPIPIMSYAPAIHNPCPIGTNVLDLNKQRCERRFDSSSRCMPQDVMRAKIKIIFVLRATQKPYDYGVMKRQSRRQESFGRRQSSHQSFACGAIVEYVEQLWSIRSDCGKCGACRAIVEHVVLIMARVVTAHAKPDAKTFCWRLQVAVLLWQCVLEDFFTICSPSSTLMHSRLHLSVLHPLFHSSHEHLTRRRPAISNRRPHFTSLSHTRQAASVKDCRPLGCGSASQSRQNILASSLNVSETLAGERTSVTPVCLATVGIHGIPRRGADSHVRISFQEEGWVRWVSDYGAGQRRRRQLQHPGRVERRGVDWAVANCNPSSPSPSPLRRSHHPFTPYMNSTYLVVIDRVLVEALRQATPMLAPCTFYKCYFDPYLTSHAISSRLRVPLTVGSAIVTTRLPPSRTGFDSRLGRSRIFARGNRAGLRRKSVDILGHFPFLPSFHSGTAPYLRRFTLIGSQNLDVKRNDRDRNTDRLARRSDKALNVRVRVARIAPSLLDLGRGGGRWVGVSPGARKLSSPVPGIVGMKVARACSGGTKLRANCFSFFVPPASILYRLCCLGRRSTNIKPPPRPLHTPNTLGFRLTAAILFPAFEYEKRGGDKDDIVTSIKCALNSNQWFPTDSHAFQALGRAGRPYGRLFRTRRLPHRLYVQGAQLEYSLSAGNSHERHSNEIPRMLCTMRSYGERHSELLGSSILVDVTTEKDAACHSVMTHIQVACCKPPCLLVGSGGSRLTAVHDKPTQRSDAARSSVFRRYIIETGNEALVFSPWPRSARLVALGCRNQRRGEGGRSFRVGFEHNMQARISSQWLRNYPSVFQGTSQWFVRVGQCLRGNVADESGVSRQVKLFAIPGGVAAHEGVATGDGPTPALLQQGLERWIVV